MQRGGKLARRETVADDDERTGIFFSLLDFLAVSLPFVTHPGGADVFRVGSVNNHDLGRAQRMEDIGLVFFSDNVAQGLAAVKDPIALSLQVRKQFQRVIAVLGSLNAVRAIAVLIGNKNIIRSKLLRFLVPYLFDTVDISGLVLIPRSRFGIGKLHGAQIMRIPGKAFDFGQTAGRDAAAVKVLFKPDTVARTNVSPMCFGEAVILLQNPLKALFCFREIHELERLISIG